MDAVIGKFIFPKAPCAYRQTIAFAFSPGDNEQPGKLVQSVLALWAHWPDAKDDALMNRAPNEETAAQITDVFHAPSLRQSKWPCAA